MKSAAGLKILVAITDGQDNRSYSSLEEIVLKAQLQEIPLYIIRVGDVDELALEAIASQTGGSYYYSSTASDLDVVYQRVKSNIQSIYGVVYQSDNFNSNDTSRTVVVRYVTDSVFASESQAIQLPEEVINYLEDRKRSRIVYGSLGLGVVVGFSIFMVFYKKEEK